MAMRRPRIKASANLINAKPRKPKAQIENIGKTSVFKEEKITKIEKKSEESEDRGESDVGKADNILEPTTLDTAYTSTTVAPINLDKERKIELDKEHQQQNTIAIEDCSPIEKTVPPLKNVDDNAAGKLETEILVSTESIHSQDEKFIQPKSETQASSFKCPPNVAYQRSNSYIATNLVNGNEDSFQTDMEEDVIQMDLLKSSVNPYSVSHMSPMSPSKTIARQRIRATPVFGQRRNSFVGSSPSPHTFPDAETAGGESISSPLYRRERHFSASLSQTSNTTSSTHLYHHHTPHKYIPTMGRIRTESGCSAFSDSYAPSTKSRKTEQDQNHRALSRRDFEARFNNGVVPDKSMLKMFDLIYYNPVTNPMEQKPNIAKLKQEANTNAEDTKNEKNDDMKSKASIKPERGNTDNTDVGLPVPQLKLNSAGELILDDKSLEIETTAEQEARKVLANSSLIFLDENTGMNGFYKRQKRTKEWPPEETIKFYRCLQTIGTDFSLMGQLFPNRKRRDLKLKFKKEERCNLALINKALLYPKTFNIDELKVQLEAEDREREEAERKWKEIKAVDAKNVKRPQGQTSAAQRAIPPNDIFYHNENITRPKLSKRAKKTNLNETNNNKSNVNNANSGNKKDHHEIGEKKQPRKKRTPLLKEVVEVDNIDVKQQTTTNVKYEIHEIENHNLPQTKNADTFNAIELENELPDFFHNVVSKAITTDFTVSDEKSADADALHQNNIIENKSLVNLDDGTVTYLISEEVAIVRHDTYTPSDIPSSTTIENPSPIVHDEDSQATCDMDESDIQLILTELSEGTMVLVSTLDPNNSDKVLNEIYMLNKATGELCDQPLDIPDAIVQGILNVMS